MRTALPVIRFIEGETRKAISSAISSGQYACLLLGIGISLIVPGVQELIQGTATS